MGPIVNVLKPIYFRSSTVSICNSLNAKWFAADETEMRLLRTACRYHSDGKLHPNPTIQTCWDADRLDIRRVGIEPDLQWYNTEAAREMLINKDFKRIDK